MASEKDMELLDQYVSNRLAAQDRAAFERKLESDASLKAELQIQQRIVEKIREARIKELKAMFNNVPISALETGTSPIVKTALWIAAAGAVGIGAHFLVNKNETSAPEITAQQEQVAPELAPQNTDSSEEPAVTQPQASDDSNNTPSSSESSTNQVPNANDTPKESSAATNQESITEERRSPAPLDVFDPSEEAETPSTERAPEERVADSAPLSKSSIVVETDNTNKKYTFHYQFKNGKLFLYGTFEKNLYEIMEFFSDNKRTVFLFYKDNYYLLNEDNEAIKPLTPISDPLLVKKLKDYRGDR